MFQMVGAELCEKCQKSIKILKERGFWDKIEFIEIDQPEGQKLAADFGAVNIPIFLVEGKTSSPTSENSYTWSLSPV